ncbi:MAG: hypothetical protein Q7U04_17280, partial [Bacteriovorax sp.]|nr:hypothetical protein [Bacteriovorax sp.]
DDKNILNQNIDKILSQLQDQTIAGVTLSKEDNYLLSKLLVHSQDRVFTLNKYNSKKLTNKTRTPYLEQLNKEPLNKMINALREISADPETIVNVESKEAINSRVTDSINKMKELINNNGCRTYLRANPNFLGEPVQTCNYKYFIDSLSVPDAQFNQIASILHFINANQYIEKNHNYGRTNLGWIQKQFAGSTTTSCKFNSADNSISIQNPPFTTGANKKVDFNKFSCTTSDSKQLKSKRCFEYLDFKTDNSGFTVSPKNKLPKGIKIASFTVDGSDQIDNSCKKVLLTSAPPEQAPPIIPSPPTIPPASPSIPAVETSISTPSTTCKDREACEERKTNNGQIKWYEELHACYILTDEADKLFLCSASGIETKLAETADSCSKKEPPLKFDETKKLCIPAEVVETADTCSKKEPPLKFDETKKICITKPKDEKCVFDPDGADLSPSQKKKCLAQLSAKPEEDDDAPDTKHEIPLKNTPLPARFVPTQVPTEQQGALRGMN